MKEASSIFIVGLPRSGSTLLSRLINESHDILCVNDLYYVQRVLAENAAEGLLEPGITRRLADYILDLISERSSTSDFFIGQIRLPEYRIASIRKKVLQECRKKRFEWSSLMDDVLTRVAQHAGKTRWADKTPQNFLHIEILHRAFPKARFLFLFREPCKILASYKYAASSEHDKRRYHPLVYALYWRIAARKYLTARKKIPFVEMVRYEDLIRHPAVTTKRISEFLETAISCPDLQTLGDNSSFNNRGRRSLSPTETWICQTVCRREMKEIGYSPSHASPKASDLGELLLLTLRFTCFQMKRLFFDKNGRQRIFALVRSSLLKNQTSRKK